MPDNSIFVSTPPVYRTSANTRKDTSVKVDLKDTGIPSGQEFILAENTLFGDDMWDSSQTFFYDPHSNRTAYATKWGGKEDGRLTYDGCTPAIEVESSACAEKK